MNKFFVASKPFTVLDVVEIDPFSSIEILAITRPRLVVAAVVRSGRLREKIVLQ